MISVFHTSTNFCCLSYIVSTSSYDKEIGVFIINKANEGNEAVYNYEIVPFSLFICARRMLLSKVIFAIYRFTLTLE